MIGLNKIGLNQVQLNLVQLNQLYLNTLCAGQKRSGGDGFPRLPGDVTRWSFKGLTNEMMAKNPRLEDVDGKGRFLTFKNFAWRKMSGVGGYSEDFSQYGYVNIKSSTYEYTRDKIILNIPSSSTTPSSNLDNIYSNASEVGSVGDVYDFTIKITGLKSKGKILVSGGVRDEILLETAENGVYHIKTEAKESWTQFRIYFWFYYGKESMTVEIEQLPYYPGFIIGDGVDDYAVTEKDLDFEDTYTVYTAFIPSDDDLKDSSKIYGVCGKDYAKDFYLRYSYPNLSRFYSVSYNLDLTLSNGFNLIACKRTADKMQFKNLLTGASIEANAKTLVKNPGLYYLWRSAVIASYAKAAIAGQVICNGHFTTDEEDTKVLNWYKKEYPWLFFDQAWTVVGKSNKDTNRATIANITGNGNNLVLSNFGFAGNSGYGEYAQNFNIDKWTIATPSRVEATKTNSSFNITEVKGTAIQLYYLSTQKEVAFTILSTKVRVTGLTDGQTINYRYFVDDVANDFLIPSDGIYNLPEFEFPAKGDYYGFNLTKVQSSCNITIEQIPNHEGYLVTDGVDDKIESPNFKLDKDFTIVGEWEFLNASAISAGIAKENSLRVFDFGNRLVLYLNSTSERTAYYVRSLNAICSDGRIYDNNWTEYQHEGDQSVESSNSALKIGYLDTYFDKLAFKNFAIYPKVLSKDDCIKAYNYLQTLKAK